METQQQSSMADERRAAQSAGEEMNLDHLLVVGRALAAITNLLAVTKEFLGEEDSLHLHAMAIRASIEQDLSSLATSEEMEWITKRLKDEALLIGPSSGPDAAPPSETVP